MTNKLYSTLVIFSHLKQLDMPAKAPYTAQILLTGEKRGGVDLEGYFSENAFIESFFS